MAYEDTCGLCDGPIGDDYIEADGCNLCRKCFDDVLGEGGVRIESAKEQRR